MRENNVKRKLAEGGTAIGTMVFEFNTTGIARIAAEAGAEFVLFDMEHTGWSVETIRTLMATARSAEAAPLVRVPAAEYHFIARVLDMGALGIMVPMVESRQQAQRIVQSAKYPPLGRRGAAFGVAHDDYQGGEVGEKMRQANQQQLIITQIETAAGLEAVEEIAAVEGVDVLWVGQSDLTNSLGIPGRFDHERYLAALDRVAEAAAAHDKTAGFMAMSAEEAAAMHRRGYRCLAMGGDLWIYQQALRQDIAAARQKIENTT